MPDSDSHILRHRDALVAAVRDAGALALKAFRSEQRSWTKEGDSPVCESDIAVDALLRERLMALAPHYGWLSEESADDPVRLDAPLVWVVDPIDGTRGYLGGRPDWCVSVALVGGGRPLLAALFAPATDEFFVAAAGRGATLNGAPMAVSAGAGLAGARVAGPKSYMTALGERVPGLVTIPRIHSLALRLARVAQGIVDIAVATGNSRDWDLAAADLLVHEAGGAVTTLTGQPVRYNRPVPVHEALVAAGPDRHAAMLRFTFDRPAAPA